MTNLKKIKTKILYKFKKEPRFKIKKNIFFKNSYYEEENFSLKFSKIKKKDRDLIKKYLKLTNSYIGYKSFLNWGGGTGVLDLLIKKINPDVEIIIIEKQNLINKIYSNPVLLKKYQSKNIVFTSDQKYLLNGKFDVIFFFGSLCYMSSIYDFFKKSKTKYVAVSRLPMVTNSNEDFIAFDSFGNHYEYFLSYKKFNKIISEEFEFLYFEEHWGGLKKNKQKIENFKIKSFDILLERKNKKL